MTASTVRDAWLERRRLGLGGSDIAVLIGESSYGSPFSLWANKVGLVPDSETSERQDIGLELEEAIGRLFHKRTGLFIAQEQLEVVHPDRPWMRATLDGLAYEGPAPDGRALHVAGPDDLGDALGPVQKKTDARFGPFKEIPTGMLAQVQWEMGAAGYDRGWLAVLHGGFRFEVYPVERDQADIDFMLEVAERFWVDHVLAGVMPPVDGSEATARAIGAIWPGHDPGKRVALDHMAEDLSRRAELHALAAAAAKLGEAIDAVDNRIKVAMADAELGTVAGVPVLSLRRIERKEFTVAATSYRTLKAASKADQKENPA